MLSVPAITAFLFAIGSMHQGPVYTGHLLWLFGCSIVFGCVTAKHLFFYILKHAKGDL
jgi:hypothetical protein